MPRAGIETWLMHVLRTVDPARHRLDFLVHTDQPLAYDEEIRSRGARLIQCLHPRNPARYGRRFLQILREEGPFDIVHSHLHLFTGTALTLARLGGIGVRIAHGHSDTRRSPSERSLLRKGYGGLQRRLVSASATHGLAVSSGAAVSLFGPRWQEDPRVRVLALGLDLKPFAKDPDPTARAELGLPADALVLGHVGRATEPKNHAFLLEIFKEALRLEPRAFGLCVGDGPLRASLEARAQALGIAGRVRFTGVRSDVPRILRSAIDAFVFPSIYEGLPLALVEAQAAGQGCIAADHLPREAFVTPRARPLALEAGAEAWARAALEEARKSVSTPAPDTSGWAFDLQRSTNALLGVYEAAIQGTAGREG
jgi:glycosyltransferase involved in cell wall biosynthesis